VALGQVPFSTIEGITKAAQDRGIKETLFSILALIGLKYQETPKCPKNPC